MSSQPPPVVVGVDDRQPTALAFAFDEAHRVGARLRVVRVMDIPVRSADYVLGRELLREERRSSQALLDDAQHFLQQRVGGPPVDYVLLEGSAREGLDAEAAEARCFVMGADRPGWFGRGTAAGLTTHLAEHAPCPVVVVPERSFTTPLDGGVVVALDGETAAVGPLAFAFDQARGRGGALHVLHAGPPITREVDSTSHRANISEVLAGWRAEYPDVRVTTMHLSDEPEVACERATERAELVVLGQSHRRHIPLIDRPVVKRVLKNVHCPVAVVPLNGAHS